MPRTLRAKLVFIVAAAALSLITLIGTGMLVTARVEKQLSLIQLRYVPKLELGPKLEASFEHIGRSLQDAVAAQDASTLAESTKLKNALSTQLLQAEGVLGASDVALARNAIDEYYGLALDISRRLIAGETGEELITSIAAMQAKRTRALELLHKAVAFDRNQLGAAFAAVSRTQHEATRIPLVVSLSCLLVVSLLYLWLSRGILRALAGLAQGFERFGRGEFDQPIVLNTRDELGDLAERANLMARSLQRLNQERDRSDWLKEGNARLVHELRGELEVAEVANRAISVLARYLEAPIGALSYAGRDRKFRRVGQYGTTAADSGGETQAFRLGEGLVGEAATRHEITVVKHLPADYLPVRSGLGSSSPPQLVLVPLVQLGRVIGVIELGCFAPFSELHSELLLSVRESVAIALEVARARAELRELLATLEQKNSELNATRQVLEKNAAELTTVSAYKTQFLNNMSHELRTPLNSMLLLSNLLAANDSQNLSEKQVEYCRTIHGAGEDLLALINQVLDLAKIESGKQPVHIDVAPLSRWIDHAQRIFAPVAREKGLDFKTELAPDCPSAITTDSKRVEQILNNLLGNALKFTVRGGVTLRIAPAGPDARWQRPGLHRETTLELSVSDTGVGIAAEHLERIFAPFEQADAGQDRRFGGTGLGLTISRELAALLGGELSVRSVVGQGTTFVCYLPYAFSNTEALSLPPPPRKLASTVPAPIAAEPREPPVLIVEDESEHAQSLGELLQSEHIEVLRVASAAQALAVLDKQPLSCVVLDLGLPDMDGLELVELMGQQMPAAQVPLVVYTGRALSKTESQRLESYSEAVVLKGGAGPSRVVDEVRKVRQRLKAGLRSSARATTSTENPAPRLDGCKVLVADDDMRTAYALSALLRAKGAEVVVADTGVAALSTLEAQPAIDIVLMDIMMPEMDGYEAMRRIRARAHLAKLPVIALTAKGLHNDRQKCIDAGATEYLTKPVDGEQLIKLMHHCLADTSLTGGDTTDRQTAAS